MEPIRWTAHEYEPRNRGNDWYWALGIIAVAGAATAVIFGNILFAIVIIIGAFVLILHARKEPEVHEFEINKNGITIGDRLYPYRTLDSFWIPDEGRPRIIIHSKRLLMPQIVIPLAEGISEDDVHAALSQYLDEEEHEESFAEHLAEWLGF